MFLARRITHAKWRPKEGFAETIAQSETPNHDLFGVSCNSNGEIPSICDRCREHGVAEPLIEVSDSWVTTTFKRPITESDDEVLSKSASGHRTS